MSLPRTLTSILFILTATIPLSHAQQENITIALVGDSTVTKSVGWGQAFASRFNDKVTVLNFARGGPSSKSFYDENRLPDVLEAKPDYVLIQFGHNDQPKKGPKKATDPETSFRDYLKIYITESQRIGAKPILISSVTRRLFNQDGQIKSSLTPWAEATKIVASEMQIPFIDLHSASIKHHNKIGQEASISYSDKPKDRTHFNQRGAEAITDLIIREIPQADVKLASYLKE